MAIYHLNVRGVSSAKGSSAVKSAAYQSGDTLTRELTGETVSYSRTERVRDTGLVLPDDAPSLSREELWNMAEASTPSHQHLQARRYEFALPRELSDIEQKTCVQDFAQKFVDDGHAVDWAIHDNGDGNPHCHMLVSAQKLGKDGFITEKHAKSHAVYLCRYDGKDALVPSDQWKAAKDYGYEKVFNYKSSDGRTLRLTQKEANAQGLTNADRVSRKPVTTMKVADGTPAFDFEKEKLKTERKRWADVANAHLKTHAEKLGEEPVSITEKSFAELGKELIPTIHEGYASREIEARGGISDRAEINREIREKNKLLKQIIEQLAQIEKAIKERVKEALNERLQRLRTAGTDDGPAGRNEDGNRTVQADHSRPAERSVEERLSALRSAGARGNPEQREQLTQQAVEAERRRHRGFRPRR